MTTVATMMYPSLALIERTGSSGRRSRSRARDHSEPLECRLGAGVGLMANSGGGFERVADPVHRADEVGAEFAPQRFDVGVHGARARGVGPVPHLREQPLPGKHGAWALREAH